MSLLKFKWYNSQPQSGDIFSLCSAVQLTAVTVVWRKCAKSGR